MKSILKNTILLFTFFVLTVSCKNDESEVSISGINDSTIIDGPYVFYENDSLKVIYVNAQDRILETKVTKVDSLLVRVPGQVPEKFFVRLDPNPAIQPDEYEPAEKIFAVSDIEGNYYAFVKLLIGNGITDENLNWVFGTGHLVLNGDFVDRGKYVTQVLWLIYKLEQEAQATGGKVHFINGNHEAMNLEGDFRYVVDKYKRLAEKLDLSYDEFYSEKNEIGRWLRSKNIIEKIGNVLFTHGGISPTLIRKDLQINDLNNLARAAYGTDLESSDTISDKGIIFGRFGPLWYRGLVEDYKYYPKSTLSEVNKLHLFFNTEKVVVGHTIVEDISTDYDGKVVRIDLHHPSDSNSEEESKALLIENGVLYKVDIKGERTEI